MKLSFAPFFLVKDSLLALAASQEELTSDLTDAVVKSIQALGNRDQLRMMRLRASQSASIDEWRQGSPKLFNGAPQ